jgi:small subunit ribosomal protein S20
MANHPSANKRIRQIEKRKLLNKYSSKTTRNAVKQLRSTTEKSAALELYPKVASMLDRLAKKNTIHKNKAANLKSKLTKYVNSLKD